MLFCKKCGNERNGNTQFCSKCGNHFENVSKESQNKDKKYFCKKCGNKLSGKENVCFKCEKITNAKEEKPEQKKHESKKPKQLLKWGLIALGIIVVIIIATVVINNRSEAGSPSSTSNTATSPTQQEPTVAKEPVTKEIAQKAYCGNKVCERGEDSSICCIDCDCPDSYSCDGTKCKKLASCGNGIIEEGETMDNCCKDIGCGLGYYCENNACQSKCGDGIKVAGETSENCCKDAGCPIGETCQNNACIVLKPVIDATFTQTTSSPSVTFLKANGDYIGKIKLFNSGNDDAKNLQIVLSSPNGYFSDKTINSITISKESQNIVFVDLNFLDKALDVTTSEEITIKAMVVFYNSANQKFTSEESFKMQIEGRNYMTWKISGMIASWVTPTQPTIKEFASKATAGLSAGMDDSDSLIQKMAARWLFESMRAYGVKYVNDAHSSGDYVQFPFETLKNKAGDCDDNAVLYASLLEAIGLNSFLVLVPGHIFSGYISSDGYAVPIETTASNFDSALSSGASEYNAYKDSKESISVTKAWKYYPPVNLPEKFPLVMPSITKQIGNCKLSFTLSNGWIAKMPIIFTNSGNAPGAGCAAMTVYDNNKQKIDDDIDCWTINPSETKRFDYVVDISFGNMLSGYYCYGY